MCVLVCSSDQFTGPVTQKVSIIQLESCKYPVKRERGTLMWRNVANKTPEYVVAMNSTVTTELKVCHKPFKYDKHLSWLVGGRHVWNVG